MDADSSTRPAPVAKKRPPRSPGRPRGVPNKATKEIKEIAQALTLGNPKVVARLLRECETGKILPPVFNKLLEYGYGRPKEMEEPKTKSRGMTLILLKGEPGKYDPLADRMPKALPTQTVIDTEPELPPDPNMPALVDIPESGR